MKEYQIKAAERGTQRTKSSPEEGQTENCEEPEIVGASRGEERVELAEVEVRWVEKRKRETFLRK